MYRNILCPIDGSTTAMKGMDEAISLARVLKSRIRFIFVLDTLIYATASGLDVTKQVRASGQEILDKAVAAAALAGVDASAQIMETSGISGRGRYPGGRKKLGSPGHRDGHSWP